MILSRPRRSIVENQIVLSRQKRTFPVFGFLSFIMLLVNSALLIQQNNNNNNNNNLNMNTNGARRLFKMLQDFAGNVLGYESNQDDENIISDNSKIVPTFGVTTTSG